MVAAVDVPFAFDRDTGARKSQVISLRLFARYILHIVASIHLSFVPQLDGTYRYGTSTRSNSDMIMKDVPTRGEKSQISLSQQRADQHGDACCFVIHNGIDHLSGIREETSELIPQRDMSIIDVPVLAETY